MKLHVENFAKIKEADIEIKGITVIGGENSTGKSTISKLLYCLFETFYNYENRLYQQKFSAIKERIERNIRAFNYDDSQISFLKYHEQNSKLVVQQIINKFNSEVNLKKYEDIVKNIFKENNIEISSFNNFVSQTFSILSTDKQREIDKLMSMSLNKEFDGQYCPIDNLDDVKVELNIKDGNISFNIINFQEKIEVTEYRTLNTEVIYYDDPFVIDDFNDKYKKHFFRIWFNNDDGMILKHSEKMRSILERSSTKIESNVYNQILSDDLLNEIEKQIIKEINGDFAFEEDDLKFIDKNINKSISIINLSSGVKSFAILLKLIEDFKISENGTLILDEPEIHLHPKWQVKYAELLVLLQKSLNLHILISSHSPYFINAIEVFSAKHEIANKCKYYLSDLDENNKAFFEDVTKNTEKIYKKLTEPLRFLNDLKYGNK